VDRGTRASEHETHTLGFNPWHSIGVVGNLRPGQLIPEPSLWNGA